MSKYLTAEGISTDDATGTIVVEQPSIALFQGTVVASAAALYIRTGMRVNRAYTPTAMKRTLDSITGLQSKNLKAALRGYVLTCAEAGVPVRNPQVIAACE